MEMKYYWDLFAETGSVEGYLLYTMMERQAAENGRNQDKGPDFKLEQPKRQ